MYKNLIIGPFIFEELDLFPKETLLAGEWCKIKKIHNQYDVYSYPLNKLKNWYSARKKSSIIYDISLKILTNFLNEIHQKNLNQNIGRSLQTYS